MSDGNVRFRCPVCTAGMVTRAANAERLVECPQCDTVLSVPFVPAEGADHQVPVADEAAIEFRSLKTDTEAELDMTPMVDVTFLLLIFFMVTAAFTMQKSFEVPAPNEQAPSTQVRKTVEDGVITVRIDEYSTFYVSGPWQEEQEAPSEQELLRRLREAREGDATSVPNTLIVEAHGDAIHEKVVMAMDAGTEVGMQEVKLRKMDDW